MVNDLTSSFRVLIIDDEPEILELLQEYLSARGVQVLSTSSAEEGLGLVKGGLVDIVVTDLQLAGMHGVDLLKNIAKLPIAVGVIVMTGYPTVESVLQTMKLGARDYLLKPFRLRDVYASIQKAQELLAEEQLSQRMHAIQSLIILSSEIAGVRDIPRLANIMGSLALQEAEASEARIWLLGANGLQVVNQSGKEKILKEFVPNEEAASGAIVDGVALVAIEFAGETLGFIAAAGGEERTKIHIRRLRVLAAIGGEALHQVGF